MPQTIMCGRYALYGPRSRLRDQLIRFGTVLLLCLLANGLFAETLTGRVVAVADGDTLTVLDAGRQQHKIRVAGIDAPEKAQPFGQRSKESLSRLTFQKDVRVEWQKRDRYERIIGKVWVQPSDCTKCGLTLDAGEAQLSSGMAWWYRKYASDQSSQDRARYAFEESEAKTRKIGLWGGDPAPIPPWEWRRR